MLKEAETFTDYVESFHSVTGRTADSNNIYESLAAVASGAVVVDTSALLGGMLSGLDNRAGTSGLSCNGERIFHHSVYEHVGAV